MSTQNYQNFIPLPTVQNNIPVQTAQNCAPVEQIQENACLQYPQGFAPVQSYPNNNYVPRYAPMVRQGQVYSVPVPDTAQQFQAPCATAYMPACQPCTPASRGSVGTVNISINGVNPPGQQNAAPMPQYYPVYTPYFVPYGIQQPQATASAISTVSAAPVTPVAPAAQELPKEPIAAAKMENKSEGKNHRHAVIELTDDYIKNLEYDLRSGSKDVQKRAVTEIVKRFKEDETRKDDLRLTKLLNLALQNDSKPIVYTAMQALENGYANGNQDTVKYLDNIRKQKDTFGNSETAEAILTMMSGKPSDGANNASPIRGSHE